MLLARWRLLALTANAWCAEPARVRPSNGIWINFCTVYPQTPNNCIHRTRTLHRFWDIQHRSHCVPKNEIGHALSLQHLADDSIPLKIHDLQVLWLGLGLGIVYSLSWSPRTLSHLPTAEVKRYHGQSRPHLTHPSSAKPHSPPQTVARLPHVFTQQRHKFPTCYMGRSISTAKIAPLPWDDQYQHGHPNRHADSVSHLFTAHRTDTHTHRQTDRRTDIQSDRPTQRKCGKRPTCTNRPFTLATMPRNTNN